MTEPDLIGEVMARLQRVEDELAIQRLVLSYGPSADAGLAARAAGDWAEDSTYDWDAGGQPHRGSAGVEAMLSSDAHQGLISRGAAHFTGPPLVKLEGDRASALTYSLVMRRQGEEFVLWRVSAVRWELSRSGEGWKIQRRTNRLLDASEGGLQLFREAMSATFAEPTL